MATSQNRKIGLVVSAVFVLCGLFPALHGQTGNYFLLVLAPLLFLAAVVRPSLYDGVRRGSVIAFSAIVYLALVVPLRLAAEIMIRRGSRQSFWQRF